MRAGYLTEKITFEENVSVPDKYGATSSNWILKKVIRAEVKQGDGRRGVINNEDQVRYPIRVITHYKHKISESWRLIYLGNTYRISSVVRSRVSMTTTVIAELMGD